MIELTFHTVSEVDYVKQYESLEAFFMEISQFGFIMVNTGTTNTIIPREQIISIEVPVQDMPDEERLAE